MTACPKCGAVAAPWVVQVGISHARCTNPDCGWTADELTNDAAELLTEVTTERDQLRGILDDLVDPTPCRLDHHGYCQEHVWMTTDGRCPHARAKEALRS